MATIRRLHITACSESVHNVAVCVARRCVLRSVECIAVGSAEEGAAGMRAVSVSEEQQTQVFREGLPLPASSFHQARTCA